MCSYVLSQEETISFHLIHIVYLYRKYQMV